MVIVICRPEWRSPIGRQIGTSEYLSPKFGRQITYIGVFAALQTKEKRRGLGYVNHASWLSLAVGDPASVFFSYLIIVTLTDSRHSTLILSTQMNKNGGTGSILALSFFRFPYPTHCVS